MVCDDSPMWHCWIIFYCNVVVADAASAVDGTTEAIQLGDDCAYVY